MRKGINILLILILCFVVPLAYGQDEEIGELKEFISPVLPETPDEIPSPKDRAKEFTPPVLPETPDEVAPPEDKPEEFTPPVLPETPDEVTPPEVKPKEFIPPVLPKTLYSPPKHAFYMFDGQWLPDIEPIKIGPNNYKTQQNLRPIDKGLEGVQGYTKINTTAVTGFPDLSHGYHFIKDQPQESHVMAWAKTSGATSTGLYKNDTAIPDQGEFSGVTIIHEDSAVSLEGRMSNAPDGNMAYCNTKVNKIWSGDEMRVASFMTSDSAATDTLTNPRDYTIQVNNKLDDSENIAWIGGGNDSPYTKLLLHFDGIDGSQTFTDSNSGSTEPTHTVSVDTTAALDTDQKKFGTSAGYFDGGTSIYVTDHVDWHMANGDGSGSTDFTIDFWARIPDATNEQYIFSQYASASSFVSFVIPSFSSREFMFETANSVETLGNELVINGDFEAGTGTGDPYIPGNWINYGQDAGEASTMDTGDVHGGVSAYHLNVDATAEGIQIAGADEYSTVAGERYKVSIWLKRTAGTIQIVVKDGDGIGNLIAEQIDAGYAGWTEYQQYVVSQETGDIGYISIVSYGGAAEWRIDDVSVKQVNFDRSVLLRSTGADLENDRWDHVAIIKGWENDSSKFALTINGIASGTTDGTITFPEISEPLIIGSISDDSYPFTGWIDEFRWTKGIARWTSNFEPPVRKYDTGSTTFVIGSPRPASGASIYVKDGNIVSGQTVTVREYNGSSWITISATGTTEPTNGLARSGKIPWSSTVDTSKPKYLENKLFYWYEFALSAGEATIYHVTLDCPFQDITDIWDSVYRQPIQFQVNRSTNWEDYTGEVNLESSDLYPIGAQMGGLTSSDHTIIMFDERMQAVFFDVLSGNTVSIPAGVSTYYWAGDEYVSTHSQFDLTDTGTTPLNKSGAVSWQPPTQDEEFKQAIFGVEGYAYKFVWNGTLNSTDEPESTLIDVVYGVPAPLIVKPFKFPVEFKKRLLLCGYTEGNQGNRIDFSLTNAPNVWNGTETSDNGWQSIYVGGNEDLTAAIQIYNRYGNNLYTNLVLFKKNSMFVLLGDGPTGDNKFQVLPVSDTIGCPAPLTLAGMELGYEVFEGELTANIIMWLSYAGVKGFDGAKPFPIKGIDSYFDPAESKCINYDYISIARGWFDPTYNEYNLLIPSGLGQTTNNVWLVYNLLEKEWYEKVPGIASMPQFGFQVADTYGAKYIYGGVTTGYLMRLENGNDWDSVTGVTQVVETGDFFPTNDPWHETRLRRLKVAFKTMNETATLRVVHYKDWDTSGTSIFSVSMESSVTEIKKHTEPLNLPGWTHRIKFEAVTSTTPKGVRLIGWGPQFWIIREDEVDLSLNSVVFLVASNDKYIHEGSYYIVVEN